MKTNAASTLRADRQLSSGISWRWKKIRKGWQLYILMLLPLAYIIIFKYIPMYGAQIAFKHFVPAKGIVGSEWIGLDHFIKFFNSYQFSRVMRNTLVISFYNLFAGFPLPIILAISLNYVNNRFFKKSMQMISFAPHFISVVVMGGIILQFLSPRVGMINEVRRLFGFKAVNFIAESEYFWHIYVWSEVWQNVGFGCIIYLAALSAIDPSLHEAATVDGANKLQRIWHVDIPGVLPIAVILFILNMGNTLDLGFEKIYLLQNDLNLRSSEVIDTYVYKTGISSPIVNFSYAAAIGFFKAVVGLILLVTVNRIARKVGQSSLW